MKLRQISPSILLAITLGILAGQYITLHSKRPTQRKSATSLYCPDEDQLQSYEEALLTCLFELDEKKGELAEGQTKLKRATEENLEERDPQQPSWRNAFGRQCLASDADVKSFFIVNHGVTCPDDSVLAQELAFKKNCFLLPRRRCFAKMPDNYVEPLPLPQSLWTLPPDSNVAWDKYHCKNFDCLSKSEAEFDISSAKEQGRFMSSEERAAGQRFSIPTVLSLKPGRIRIGLDIGGGTGSFAAQMAAFNVTILTTGMNAGAPHLETIALRGLVPLFLPQQQQLPVFNNALDMIHLSNSIQILEAKDFEAMVYDWHRALRPGGLLWIDPFCSVDTIMRPSVNGIEQLNYTRHEWVLEQVNQEGISLQCLTTLLEKPIATIG